MRLRLSWYWSQLGFCWAEWKAQSQRWCAKHPSPPIGSRLCYLTLRLGWQDSAFFCYVKYTLLAACGLFRNNSDGCIHRRLLELCRWELLWEGKARIWGWYEIFSSCYYMSAHGRIKNVSTYCICMHGNIEGWNDCVLSLSLLQKQITVHTITSI